MRKPLLISFLSLLLFLGTCVYQPSNEQYGIQTIWWEEDKDGFLQFCTNDSQHNGYSFIELSGPHYDPMGTVEAEVKKISGSVSGEFGIVFCYQDIDNFYLLSIDIKGFYAIYKKVNRYWTTIAHWSYSNELNKGYSSINTLKVSYTNLTNTFSIIINDNLITTFVDSSFRAGHSGYFVDVLQSYKENFPEYPVDVRFRSKGSTGITVSPTSGLVTTEDGVTDSFTVVLNTQPAADVFIGLWNSDTTEGTASPESLTFTSDNWSVPQTVTVTGVDDLLDDENRIYTIVTVPAVSADPDYDGYDARNVLVCNTDNDPPYAPDNLIVTAVSSNQNDLIWNDNSINEDGFKIERKQGTNGSFAEIGTVGANVNVYSDTAFTRAADTIYYYRVRPYNICGDLNYSNEASAMRKVEVPDIQREDWYGGSVDIDGEYAIVGAKYEDEGGSDAGAAYIFYRTGANSWDSGTKLLAPDYQAEDLFGCSVAIDGDYAIVGAEEEDEGGIDSGAAYIFRCTGANSWDSGTKLLAPDAQINNEFGRSVAISGDYAIVGARGEAYVFHRIGVNSWDSGTKVLAPDQKGSYTFGWAVALDGDYAIIGAEAYNDPSWLGAAYIFHRTDINSWDSGTQLLASDPQAWDSFGCSVAISGEYAVVGAYGKDTGLIDVGAAYIFQRTDINVWDSGTKIQSSDPFARDYFGFSVAIDGNYAVVGEHGDNEGGTFSGAIHIFHIGGSGTKIYQSENGSFGYSVGIDGDHTIVGYGVYILY